VSSSSPVESPREDAEAPWYRRRGVLLAGTVVVVVAIAVVTDLPTPASRASQVATANAFVAEINTDLAPCDYSLGEAYGIRADQLDGTVPAADVAQIPSLLRDDEMACSYAGPTISDLTSIESPGTVANRPLGQMLSTATQWATYDALSALDDIQELFEHPDSTSDASGLVRATSLLERDRASARSSIRASDQLLDATLDQVDMVAVKVPGGS
jgi:hypothetical protein